MPDTIQEVLAEFSPEIQEISNKIMETMRNTIENVMKDYEITESHKSVERLTWGMPTFTLYKNETKKPVKDGNIIHFFPCKTHIGLYPGSEAVEVFAAPLAEYTTTKGAVQFPYKKPMAYELIGKITEFNLKSILGEKQ